MRLVVLGSGTSLFHPQRTAAGFWLETDAGTLLLDCGADAPHRMAQEQLDWATLDAIWISHLHLDHCGGLAPFLFGIKHAPQAQQRRKPLTIFGCAGIAKLLRAIDESHHYKLFSAPFPIEIKEIEDGNTAGLQILPALNANFFRTPHRPESLAVRLTHETGTTLVYTSDTGYAAGIADFAREADLLILECSFYRNKPVATHLELSEAMQIARAAAPRQVLLTHLYFEWDGIDLAAEARKLWPGETVAAVDGLRLEI